MDAALAGLLGTALGGLLSFAGTAWTSASQSKSALRRVEAEGHLAAQAAMREDLRRGHEEFLSAIERVMYAADYEEDFDYTEAASWDTESFLLRKAAPLRLLADPVTVEAALAYVEAAMHQLNLDESLYRQQRDQNNFIPNWSRATRPERDAVSRARDNYIHMAQADLGLASPGQQLRSDVRTQPAPHPEWRDWRDRDAYYESLANTRLAELELADRTGGPDSTE